MDTKGSTATLATMSLLQLVYRPLLWLLKLKHNINCHPSGHFICHVGYSLVSFPVAAILLAYVITTCGCYGYTLPVPGLFGFYMIIAPPAKATAAASLLLCWSLQ